MNSILQDEDGRNYVLKTLKRLRDRKTYVIGKMNGKYYGELDEELDNQYNYPSFYTFNIYEVEIVCSNELDNCICETGEEKNCNGIHKETDGPFPFESDVDFPRDKLPREIPCIIKVNGQASLFAIVLKGVQFRNVDFNRRLHQKDGNEIFGTITADVSGYIIDQVEEEYWEKVYVEADKDVLPEVPIVGRPEIILYKTSVPTGQTENKGSYRRIEYYYSDYKKTYWGPLYYIESRNESIQEGCLSSFIGTLGILLSIIFIILILPALAYVLPLILLPLILGLLSLIPRIFWKWLARILCTVVLLSLLMTLFRERSRTYLPMPVTTTEREVESRIDYTPVTTTDQSFKYNDTLISHYRTWQDYEGKNYSGTFSVRLSHLKAVTKYKTQISLLPKEELQYDNMVYSIKNMDTLHLKGVYRVFDSIKLKNNLDQIKFAEMVVTFIQDIPYTLLLEGSCDPSLYDDKFIKNYLKDKSARCDGFLPFGINSPVEFMASFNGDCDTRTLFLYTIFAHYNYDVVMLSSEYYNHSLLGINLPISGISYNFGDRNYVLWETTAPGFKTGLISSEIDNMNYWRISLKSE